MKQKYTITVADMELNIISDASPDEVENIVGMLDRRMRDINLKSPRCTKNEAALLCALSYCSERIAMQEAFKKVEKDAFRFAGENEKLKKNIETLEEELEKLRQDAAVMRSLLDRATLAPQSAPAQKKKVEKSAQISAFDEIAVADAQAEAEEAPVQPTAPVPPVVIPEADEQAAVPASTAEDTSAAAKKTTPGKSRVGTMFDLLTFSDV